MHKKEELKKEEIKKQEARNISLKEGAAASSSVALGDNYLPLLALELKAQPFYMGALSALTGLISPIAQLFGTRLMEHKSRKSIATLFVTAQALMWIPVAFLSYLAWKGASSSILLLALIVCYTLILAFHGISYSPWFSWMGDIVSENERGRYFAKRHRIGEIVGMILFLSAGFVLDLFKTQGLVMLGFSMFFLLSGAARLKSYLLLKKQYEPKLKLSSNYYFSFWQFIKRMDNYGKFAISYGLFNLAIMIASPFFIVYMQQELKFSYTILIIVNLSSGIFYLLFTPLVGRYSDRFGNRRLFYLSSILFAINPILWIFIKTPLFLIILPQLIVGLANAALIISITNFTYDSAKPEHRSLCMAYTSVIGGLGVVVGSLLGGAILTYITLPSINPFVVLFSLAAILRFAIPLFFISHLKEVKKVEPLPHAHLNIMHPIKTIHSEISWIKEITADKHRKV